MKNIVVLCILLLFSCSSKKTSFENKALKESAIAIESLTDLNDKIYKEVSKYDVIMMGEIHGTKEPSQFVLGICKLIAEKEGEVALALEIPPSQMKNFSTYMSYDEIRHLTFFKGEGSDGRNGKAWLEMLSNCNNNEGIHIHFIDSQELDTRDLSMFNQVLKIRTAYPNIRIVTLTGNVHNSLTTFRNKMKLGTLVVQDTVNFKADKVMSINHHFNHGTMLNNIGNGLELRIVEGGINSFNLNVSAEIFLCDNVFRDVDRYTHTLYTEYVTHSDTLMNR